MINFSSECYRSPHNDQWLKISKIHILRVQHSVEITSEPDTPLMRKYCPDWPPYYVRCHPQLPHSHEVAIFVDIHDFSIVDDVDTVIQISCTTWRDVQTWKQGILLWQGASLMYVSSTIHQVIVI